MVMVKANAESEAGALPSAELMAAMGRFNEEMVKAGVMLAGEGLQASSKGARIRYDGGRPTVTDGPFTEAKELVAGFWLIQVKSKEEAVEWMSRCPMQDGDEIEIRQIFEDSDFPEEILPPESAERQEAMRRALEANAAKR
jgi:hypothetical protein